MKKIIFAIVLVAVLGVAAFTFVGGTTAKPTPTPQAKLAPVKASSRIISEGKVVPVRSAAISFLAGGNVAKVPVAFGDRVTAGQTLVELDTRQLEIQLAQADANLASAQAKLNQLKNSPTAQEVASAKQNVVSAQAAYDNLLHPGTTDIATLKADLEKAKAAHEQAVAAYDRVGGDSNPYANMLPQRVQLQTAWLDYQKVEQLYNAKLNPTNAQVQQALATLESAKNQLAKLQPTADDLAGAQASVNAAQAARDLAAEQLKNAKLVAPFAGVVTALDVKAGEYVVAGTPVVRLADTSSWQVETTDLTELNVVNVHEGAPVVVAFDAIPNLELPGKVVRIKGYGENRQGDIVYTVVVALDQMEERLRWNMTAKVTIEPIEK